MFPPFRIFEVRSEWGKAVSDNEVYCLCLMEKIVGSSENVENAGCRKMMAYKSFERMKTKKWGLYINLPNHV